LAYHRYVESLLDFRLQYPASRLAFPSEVPAAHELILVAAFAFESPVFILVIVSFLWSMPNVANVQEKAGAGVTVKIASIPRSERSIFCSATINH
jgi:hypothetical protein